MSAGSTIPDAEVTFRIRVGTLTRGTQRPADAPRLGLRQPAGAGAGVN